MEWVLCMIDFRDLTKVYKWHSLEGQRNQYIGILVTKLAYDKTHIINELYGDIIGLKS